MPTATYTAWDRALGGQLESMLRGWSDEGLPYARMAERLRADHDVDVSHETVRRWCVDLGIENPRARTTTPTEAAS